MFICFCIVYECYVCGAVNKSLSAELSLYSFYQFSDSYLIPLSGYKTKNALKHMF